MVRRSHSFTVDYFALGVIAYEMMLGRRPYVGANRKEIKDQILARQAAVRLEQLPFKWSPSALDFINKVLISLCSFYSEILIIDSARMELKRSKSILGFLTFNGINYITEKQNLHLDQS